MKRNAREIYVHKMDERIYLKNQCSYREIERNIENELEFTLHVIEYPIICRIFLFITMQKKNIDKGERERV